MIKTMIVEDEKIILEDILDIVDWKAEGFEIVATAANGKQGLQKFDKFHPELVITDIRMPVMNGLDMLRSIRHANESTYFLILSSYDEFEYAKSAVRLGAEDYLLKTEISEDCLKEKLAIIRQKITRRSDMLLDATKQKLQSYIHNYGEASQDKLADILSPLQDASPKLVETIRDFAVQMIRSKYGEMDMEPGFNTLANLSVQILIPWLEQVLDDMHRRHTLIYDQRHSPVIVNAIDYIRKNYHDSGLKIDAIAYAVGLSSGRLSVLFKKEMNCTLNEFITKTRVDEAKRLLSKGTYKVYEVSEMVGFPHEPVFQPGLLPIYRSISKCLSKGVYR